MGDIAAENGATFVFMLCISNIVDVTVGDF